MQNVKYIAGGFISADIDGTTYIIPDDTKNRHRQMVAAWEALGNTIEPYETPGISREDVNSERDRRITSGFLFRGKIFDFDDKSKQRVAGAATLAGFAIGAGAPVGYLRWHGGDKDFAWITQDNTLMPMDAQTCFLFGQTAAEHESNLIFKAKDLKNINPIPSDYTDDKYWG